MNLMESLVYLLAGRGLPWVARIYFLLIILFGGIVVWVASQAGGQELPDSDLRVQLFSLAADGLKTVLGALIGSLSLAGEALWKTRTPEPLKAG
jgi:hypothetical protein